MMIAKGPFSIVKFDRLTKLVGRKTADKLWKKIQTDKGIDMSPVDSVLASPEPKVLASRLLQTTEIQTYEDRKH